MLHSYPAVRKLLQLRAVQARHAIERIFCWPRLCRLATRYNKSAVDFFASAHLAATFTS